MEQVRLGQVGEVCWSWGRPEDTGTHRLGLVRMGGLLVLSHLRINMAQVRDIHIQEERLLLLIGLENSYRLIYLAVFCTLCVVFLLPNDGLGTKSY